MNVAGLVLEAAEGGVLDRRGFRVQRVDLNDPAEAVRLVRLLGAVEAVVEALPLAVGLFVFDAEALEGLLGFLIFDVASSEVLVKVLLAGEHGVPRGHATGAVVQGAQDGLALGIGLGLDQAAALRRADELKRGRGGAAAVEWAELACVLAGALDLGDLQNGVAVASPADLDLLLGRVVRVVVREHHRLGGVLVGAHVDHAGVVGRVLDEAREVVVEAELLLGIGCGLLVDVELWSTLDDWVAPCDEHGLLVAGRDDDLVLGVGLDGVEKHALCGGQLHLGVGSLAAARSGGGASSRIGGGRRARGKRRGAADGDHGQAAGAQGGAAGDLVAEVFVIRGVFAFTQAGVAALIGAGKA